jgi:ferric-dicitrate binding protein FerR (iron transport regulator)
MDDEIKELLRAILQTQQEHLKVYREFSEKATKYQEIALQGQETALRRQKAQTRNALIADALIALAGLLILWSLVSSRH